MKAPFVLSIDQGTTGTRAVVYDASGAPAGSAYQEFRQYFPRPGWVEHDPREIWAGVLAVTRRALARAKISSSRLAAIGVTNQRETSILWDKETGKPAGRAVVWQDRRTAGACAALKNSGAEKEVRLKTGLVLDPYFSGTKIQWLLKHAPGLKKRAREGKILFGTVDSWLLWNLTGGRRHVTDFTNASRTLLLNIKTGLWDPDLLRLFGVPRAMLPDVMDSGARFGETAAQGPLLKGIPVVAVLGDQQAALYGQGCCREGEVKNTYGTGCFILLNLGPRFRRPPPGLLATLACDRDGKKVFALEGSIFIAGAAIQWLRDGLKFFRQASRSEAMARSVPDSGGVVVIPALTGLGSPYWEPLARGMITGLTRGTRQEHIARATLESIAHQTADVLERMESAGVRKVRELKVDGGATANRFLMQFQADLLGIPVRVSAVAESTAWGAAKLAGKIAGIWAEPDKIDRRRKYRLFRPHMSRPAAQALRAVWKREMARLLGSGPSAANREF
ncbi:MAG: glycerol kinase GlpK [Elusimicrobia bacterium]|nr:glycerol kinase GlpK [Elusimicrobiota bacterium]